ncbi:sensor domain-containing protein [Nocardia sp. NBC_00508]|uniref:sensor histidine kinase n=1 Tax=Nocardia sp. NBC_00508 TaxID=2975992 RepID=UPI002E81938C|nr:sensor domain-containing protein [Nocardia sp. NBC_00508]WUD69143.1 sensor domain-containing protein [Nocardia sp. NBC_00508]
MIETHAEATLVLDPSPGEPEPAEHLLRTVLLAPVRARFWKELVYVLTVFVLGCAAVAYLFFGLGGGLYLAITIIGLPVLALVLLGGRVWGRIYRALAKDLLGVTVAPPLPFAPAPGLIGFIKGALTDRVSWRAVLFLLAQAVLGVAVGYLVLVTAAMTMFTAISPIPWALVHPTNVDENGVEHRSMVQFGDFYVDSWPKVLGFALLGALGCLVLPWLLRGVCLLHRLLTIALLSATLRDRRMVELQESRRTAVEDSAATLRRLERDLHDGTQARLVTIAMALGRAEDRLAAGGNPGDLIADAHASSKEALTELRELVRGIHPPALELGLEPALETLTARCSVPVELRVHLPGRPSPAIEAIAYFSVAELLTNVVRHANATGAWVSVLPNDARTIAVTVRDNGIGGVVPPTDGAIGAGSGLSGLAARARTVDGTLTVQSPAGGPTVVTILLPLAGSR